SENGEELIAHGRGTVELNACLVKHLEFPFGGRESVSMIRFPTVIAVFAACFLSACGEKNSDSGATKPLVVGMEMAYPPFEMRGPDNQPDGVSVRMAEDLAASLGRPLKLRDVEWNGIIPALQSGKIDVIISSMTRTPEREAVIAFSEGYVTNG